MLHNKGILLVFLFFIPCLFCFDNNSYAADVEAFEEYVKENKSAWVEALEGYDYIIVNNTYNSWLTMYYTTGNNNVFSFFENDLEYGDRRVLTSSSDLGTDKYDVIVLNDGTNNNFWIPTTLQTEFEGVTGLNHIVNNFSLDNIIYSSKSFYADGVLIEDKISIPQLWVPTELAMVTSEAGLEKALAEIVAILPMILLVVVCFLGLRKALSMLLTLLRQS